MFAPVARRGASADVSPSALKPEELARLLTVAARRDITVENIHADIRHGAPTNADGTINLVHYAAWLLAERRRGRE